MEHALWKHKYDGLRMYEKLMPLSDYKKAGFSLLELIIVITIIAILGSVGFVKLTDYFTRNNLDKDAQKIAFTLKNARDRSISQDRGLQWGVHFENSASGKGFYELFSGTGYPGQTILRNNLNIGVEFLNPSASSTLDILFSKITGLASASTTIVVALSDDNSIIKSISISGANSEISY